MAKISLRVNGRPQTIDAEPDMPLLYALRNDLKLNGAKFGLMMPGTPLIGGRYYNEIAPKVAMDRSEIISMTETVETIAGTFKNCLKIEETNPLEPGTKEYKYYARGIGLVNDNKSELVKYGMLDKSKKKE